LKKRINPYLYGIIGWSYENTDYNLSKNGFQLNSILAKNDCQYIWCTPYIILNSIDQVYEFFINYLPKIKIDAVSLNNYILPNPIYPYASYDPLSQILTINN